MTGVLQSERVPQSRSSIGGETAIAELGACKSANIWSWGKHKPHHGESHPFYAHVRWATLDKKWH